MFVRAVLTVGALQDQAFGTSAATANVVAEVRAISRKPSMTGCPGPGDPFDRETSNETLQDKNSRWDIIAGILLLGGRGPP